MRRFCRIVKVFFKSGIITVEAFIKRNKKLIIILIGKFVIFVCKTVIESFIHDLK